MPPSQSDAMSVSAPVSTGYLAQSAHHTHSASTPSLSSPSNYHHPMNHNNNNKPMQTSASAPSSPTHPSASAAPTISMDSENRKERVTVTVFDWDDTLLASSFLSGRGYRLDSEIIHADVEAQLRELETSVVACLSMALQYGDVHIITNAENGWVELSARRFIPKVVPLLSQVKVMSARSTYEGMFPESPLKWKFYAMHEKLSGLFGQTHLEKNIISFGDSHVEREAVRAVTRCPFTVCKSVKFAERPSMEQLRRQIELVTNCFGYIHQHQGELDLQLTVTVNVPDQPQQTEPQAVHQPAPAAVSPPSCMFPQNAMTEDVNDVNMMAEDKTIAC